MSELNARRERSGALRDVLWLVAAFVLLGVGAGVLWWTLAHPPYFLRGDQGASMDQSQLGHRIGVDGSFAVIGLVAGLLAGFVLVGWRRRDPLLVLLLGLVLSVGAGLLALHLGEALGDKNMTAAVRAASPGDHVVDKLHVISSMVVVAWPAGFLLAAVSVLFGIKEPAGGPLKVTTD